MVASWPTPSLADGHLVVDDDWNLHVDNLNDLNTRLGTIEGQTLNSRLTTVEGAYVPNTRTLTTSNGLSGGGDLSADRTITPVYGTDANTIAQGNDSRITITQDATVGNNALGTRLTALEAARNTVYNNTADQAIDDLTETLVIFPNLAGGSSTLVTKNDANNVFTLTKAGVWLIEVSLRFAMTAAFTGSDSELGNRWYRVSNGGVGAGNAIQNIGQWVPAYTGASLAPSRTTFLNSSLVMSFPANQTIGIPFRHSSGASGNMQGSIGATAVHLSFAWLGAS